MATTAYLRVFTGTQGPPSSCKSRSQRRPSPRLSASASHHLPLYQDKAVTPTPLKDIFTPIWARLCFASWSNQGSSRQQSLRTKWTCHQATSVNLRHAVKKRDGSKLISANITSRTPESVGLRTKRNRGFSLNEAPPRAVSRLVISPTKGSSLV
jgi:hypothetical protein